MKNLTSLFETPLAGTFGQTMLHSLWQGVIIVGIYLIAVRFIKSANTKTWAGLAAFGLQFLTSVLTFTILMPSESVVIIDNAPQSLGFTAVLNELVTSQTSQSYLELIQENAHWLSVGWIIGFVFLFIRQMGGLFYVQFLKSTGISELSQKTEKAIDSVLKKVDGKIPSFQAFHSTKVDTAMVLGAFKPVILIPTSLASGLSTEQLELIIAHEVAHIKRNDFLINLMQTLLENLFFYHPVYWLVSHQIRENREHACDDWATDLTGNKVLLAKTLAQIQLANHQPSLAMAFGKKRMPMLGRIQRLLGVTPETQKVKFTALLLMLTSICTLGFVQNEYSSEIENEAIVMASDLEIVTQIEEDILTKSASEIRNETTIKTDTGDVDIDYNYDYDLGDRNLNITTNDYKIKIEPEKIVINGKEQALTAAQKNNLKMHFDEMDKANKNIEIVSKDIQVEVKKITDLQQKVMAKVDFNPQSDPEFQKSMEQIQKESQMIAKYATEFQSDISKLDSRASNYEAEVNKLEKAFESKVKVHEAKMENFEVNMEGFEERMKDFEIKMEKDFEIPAKEIEVILEKKEVIIDKHADDMEKHHDAILKMLPKEVQDHLGMSMHNRPARPERPERPEKPVKPQKAPKPEKPVKPAKPEKAAKRPLPPTPPFAD